MNEKKSNDKEQSPEEVIYEDESLEKAGPDLEKLHKKLKECQGDKDKYLAGWQRAQADLINYRRRQDEHQAERSKFYGESLIKDILPALDSLGAAIASSPKDQGLILLKNQLDAILKKHGLEEIKSAGETFNPEIHEVVEYEEGDKNREDEMITEEIQKGYALNGKVIRASKVKITKNCKF
jgi:molecular chaperone GrpE